MIDAGFVSFLIELNTSGNPLKTLSFENTERERMKSTTSRLKLSQKNYFSMTLVVF